MPTTTDTTPPAVRLAEWKAEARLLRAALAPAFAACDAALAAARQTISTAGQLPVGNEKQPQP